MRGVAGFWTATVANWRCRCPYSVLVWCSTPSLLRYKLPHWGNDFWCGVPTIASLAILRALSLQVFLLGHHKPLAILQAEQICNLSKHLCYIMQAVGRAAGPSFKCQAEGGHIGYHHSTVNQSPSRAYHWTLRHRQNFYIGSGSETHPKTAWHTVSTCLIHALPHAWVRTYIEVSRPCSLAYFSM